MSEENPAKTAVVDSPKRGFVANNLPIVIGSIIIIGLFLALLLTPSPRDLRDERKEVLAMAQIPDDAVIFVTKEPETLKMSLSTDKDAYGEGDNVMLTINVSAPEAINNATIKFFGIKNKIGGWTVKRTEIMTLAQGPNSIETKTNMPYCSKCSGVTPGNHSIWAAVFTEGGETQLINTSAIVELLDD